MSLVARMTPYWAHRFRVTACKALLSGRAIESREKGGEKHIQVQASTHRFDKAIPGSENGDP
jgi:hypothetical protein